MQQQENDLKELQNPSSVKKEYHSPVFHHYGDITEMTKNVTGAGNPDNPTMKS